MSNEITSTEQPVQAPQPSILDEVRKERVALEKIRDELKQLRSIEILSGKADAGVQPVPKKEETPKEYKDRVLRGEF